jgi:hypothetical protein
MECQKCGVVSNDDPCPWCESRREELLERLEPDRKATPFSEIAAQGMFIRDITRLRRLREREGRNDVR